MAHLTNVFFEFFYKIFTEDGSVLCLYHGAKKSKMTKNPNQGGVLPGLLVTTYNIGAYKLTLLLLLLFLFHQNNTCRLMVNECCGETFEACFSLSLSLSLSLS